MEVKQNIRCELLTQSVDGGSERLIVDCMSYKQRRGGRDIRGEPGAIVVHLLGCVIPYCDL